MQATATEQAHKVIARAKEILALAGKMYNLDMSKVGIALDLKGRAAGMAYQRGSYSSGVLYGMRFNRDMLTRDAFEHLYNDTIPHEIAHIVCFMKPSLGRSHDSGWASICEALGGSGQRCHKEAVVYGKGVTYEYISTHGKPHRFSQVIHARIQEGRSYTLRNNGGKINKDCAHSIVGAHGRTLATPVVKQAAKPAVQLTTSPAINPVPTFFIGAPVVEKVVAPVQEIEATFDKGASKASIARAIMLAGYTRKLPYESIIAAIMSATGHDRQLARATYKANCAKVGIPE
jgi:predicted SprT family Zn-dependent metalloprotease